MLVGDFDPDDALARVKKYFGAIPRQPAPPVADLREEPHYGERSETIFDPLARLPRIDMAYHIPAGNAPDNYAMQQFAAAISGQSSRLYQHLVKDKQLASNVQVFADSRVGPGQFYFLATPRQGVAVADLQKALDDEIADIVKGGITADEFAKARTQLLRRFIERRRSTLAVAQQIGEYTVKFGDPNLINTLLDKENAVTLEQVNKAAKTFLVRDQRTVVITLPAPKDTAQPASGPSSVKGAQ